ncbi:MAG TPA: Xaa-Pro peptidase family protein [Longimicrobiales bacterium]|nr:Xaa-Pro peptidase family protein [Longimicrobiales bacterium]
MKRRDFLRQGAVGASVPLLGGASVLGATPAEPALHPAIAALRPVKPDEPPPIGEAEMAERRRAAQRLMAEQRIDALFIEPGANLLYFTGIRWGRSERLFGMLLPKQGSAIFIAPAFEARRAQSQIGDRYEIRAWEEDQSPYRLIADTLGGWGTKTGTLAVDESARYFVAHEMAKVAPALRATTAETITRPCRGVKSAHEIEIMRFANAVTLEAYRAALQTLREGMTQAELGASVQAAFKKLGYDGYALVLFGESSAYPHGLEKPRALESGQIVLVDGGMSVHGYESDMTRTVVFGTPTDEQRRVFDIVHEAQARALAFAAPGKKCGEVDAVARKVISDAGFGPDYKFFTHRLGHGIGLEGHEWPYLVRGSEIVLRPGMTFSDEPGIYQYGKFGLRLEDIMAITESGAELLTPPATSLAPTLA